MEVLFGLKGLEDWDVVYSIMNHHYRGSYRFWPGFGLINPRMSQTVENVQSAITGLRTLVSSLRANWRRRAPQNPCWRCSGADKTKAHWP